MHSLIIAMLSALLICHASTSTLAAEINDNTQRKTIAIQKLTDIENSIKNINNDIKEVRRDQLNYKIEKDLMKEMYSSNLQIINIVIAIIAAVFAFLGFFGLRDITSLQKSYKKELDRLVQLKSDFEQEITNIQNEQSTVKQTYDEIIKTNEDQNKKIKLLEIRDKARSLLKDKSYYNAIEYCAVGLELDPKSTDILFLKAIAQFKLKQYTDSIKTHLEILNIDDTMLSVKVNLCELYLIAKDIDSYTVLYDKIKSELAEKFNSSMDKYLEFIKLYIENNDTELKDKIKDYLNSCETGKRKWLGNWDFSDFMVFLKSQPNSTGKDIIKSLISFFEGQIDKNELLQTISVEVPQNA